MSVALVRPILAEAPAPPGDTVEKARGDAEWAGWLGGEDIGGTPRWRRAIQRESVLLNMGQGQATKREDSA